KPSSASPVRERSARARNVCYGKADCRWLAQYRNGKSSRIERIAPVAIQSPAAPAGCAMRIRNSGFEHGDVMLPMLPEKPALPDGLSRTGMVSYTFSVLIPLASCSPGLHTSVPVTWVTGPGVPLNCVPLMTSPVTLKNAAPVLTFTAARPLRADHANVPLWMSATGLSTF